MRCKQALAYSCYQSIFAFLRTTEALTTMLQKIKSKLSSGIGIRVGEYRASFRISRVQESRAPSNPMLSALDVRQALYLRSKFDFLAQFDLPIEENTASGVLNFYYKLLPSLNGEAREVAARNALRELQKKVPNSASRERITLEIAKSDLRNGIPDRSKVLRETELRDSLENALAVSDAAYGANLVTGSWPHVSRGRALKYFFQNHDHLLRGKRILHFSPEEELREWIQSIRSDASIEYTTSNIVGDDVDTNQDLTNITLKTQFHVIICHRVLEHVLDDATAMSELFRVLVPGGVLSVSVPQSMQLAKTCEWDIPDETHHGHVRHYGADFKDRLTNAGFRVIDERWLLDQAEDRLKENNAFPLRMYLAYKPF